MPTISGNVGAVFNGGTITTPLVVANPTFQVSAPDPAVVVTDSTTGRTWLSVSGGGPYLTGPDGVGSALYGGNISASSAINVYDASIDQVLRAGGSFTLYDHAIAKLIEATEATRALGFYGHAPTALQTGVAVSAAGIHAALVNLGLITA